MNGAENRRGNLCETVARGGDTQRFARVVVMDFQNVSSSSVGCSRCCGDPTNVDSASTVVAVGARRGGQSCVGEGNQFVGMAHGFMPPTTYWWRFLLRVRQHFCG